MGVNLVLMVLPRSVAADGRELPDGASVPSVCHANFYIASDELRREVHVLRLQPGVHFTMVEGTRIVATCIVKRLLSLQQNPI